MRAQEWYETFSGVAWEIAWKYQTINFKVNCLYSRTKSGGSGSVAKINSSSYGFITIDNKTYHHDVYVLPSGKVVEREYGHTFTKDQVEYVLKENPDTVVIGKGTSGLASLGGDARALLENKGIEIVEADTPAIVRKFNELAETKRVAAIIHVTC